MTIRILVSVSSVHGSFRKGEVLRLALDVAHPLIDAGLAELVMEFE